MKSSSHSFLLHRSFQYLGVILIVGVIGGGYWYWREAQAGVNLQSSQEGSLTNGLVGYWSFDGNDISGTTAYDRSGNTNNGTLTNGPTKTIGKSGQALSFNGTSQYVTISDSSSLKPPSAIAMCAWVNPASASQNAFAKILSKDYVTPRVSPWVSFGIEANSGNFVAQKATSVSTSTILDSGVGIVAGTWTHVCSTYDGTTWTFYVNGISRNKATDATGLFYSTGAVSIGANSSSGEQFNGPIDEPRIYNRALSASEIWDLYQMGAADKVNAAESQGDSLEKGMVGYWKLDDGSGTSASDASGNGNTGTLTNGPTWTTGRIGGATDFDGTDDYIAVPDSQLLDVTGALTVSAWVKSDLSSAAANKGIAAKWLGNDGVGNVNQRSYDLNLDFQTDNNNPRLSFSVSPDGTSANGKAALGTTKILSGQWYHVTGVYRPNTSLVVYVNGAEDGKNVTGIPASLYNSSAQFTPGGQYCYVSPCPSYVFDGSLDEVRVYNRALSAEEVAKLYKTTAPDDPDTGLVGYWPFNGPDIAGTTAYDRSGKGNNGTLTNGPTRAIGKSGQALSLDGSDDYASIADNATLDFGTSADFALSGWVYRDTSTTDDTIIAKRNGIANTDDGYIVYIDDVDDKLHFEVSENSGTDEFELVSNSTFTTPGWNYVAIVWDDDSTANTEIYINGIADSATETGTQSNIGDLSNALTLRTGAESDGGNPFDGILDEVRVYNRALSATEIKDQYDQGGRIGWICGNGTVADADNNIYGTIQIGTQCWMRQNLRVGTRISASTNQTNNGTIEKYCYSDSDANCTSANPNQPDGGLYQWNEAMQYVTTAGARGICPAGWHIPTDAEQYTLENYLKDAGQTCNASRSGAWDCSTAGTKLKPGGTSGFEGNLAGYAGAGSFFSRGAGGYFWSSSGSGADAWLRVLSSAGAAVYRNVFGKAFGLSVRCLQD